MRFQKTAFVARLVILIGVALPALSTSVTFSADGQPIDRLILEGYDDPGYGRHIVLIAGDDEYRSEETMPMLGKILAKHHGFKCTVLFSQDPENPGVINPNYTAHIPGLEELRTADLVIFNIRFRTLPDEQMEEIDAYLKSGRPVIGLRTANHGFRFPEDSKWRHYGPGDASVGWPKGFGGKVLGSWFFGHHGRHGRESTRGILVADKHEILNGIEEGEIWGTSDVYAVEEPIQAEDVEILVRGQVLEGMNPDDKPVGPGPYDHRGVKPYLSEGSNDKNDPMQALAWTMSYQLEGGRKGRVFSTTLGSSEDFITEGSRRMVVNGVYWCLGMPVPGAAEVTPVGGYEPTRFKNYQSTEHWAEVNLRVSDLIPEEPMQNDPKEAQGEVSLPYFDVTGGREGHGYEYTDHPVNRHRLYHFYARQAEHYLDSEEVPEILPGHPGLDAGTFGHWGAFSKNGYKGRQWNLMEVGSVFANIFRHDETKAQKVRAIAVKLADDRHVLFDTETLSYTHFWEGDFVEFDPGRWGIGKGIKPGGEVTATDLTEAVATGEDFRYLGYYRDGKGVTFHYRVGDETFYDTPGLDENGKFVRTVSTQAPEGLLDGSDPLYTDRKVVLAGQTGERIEGSPFTFDRIPVPLWNEFGSSMLIGGHDFFSNGDAAVCTMFGDVWRVSGLDDDLNEVTWQRIATGLNQALGVYIEREDNDALYVVGRDRISRLHDLNGDHEIDHYENFNDTYRPNPGGHSFHTGLQRDSGGYFYFVAAEDGLTRVAPDGSSSEIIATGLRNANGVGADPNGHLVTTSNNEGDWTPTSAVYEVVDGDFYGRKAKQDGPPIAPPLAYIPRGLDNSSGGQVFSPTDTWGPLGGQLFHFSFGAGTWMMILRDEQEGKRTQGAVVPLPGDFESGAHRGRFHPIDGQLYVTGADGWGNYAITDGDFVRIRYTGEQANLPTGFEAWKNGLVVEMAEPVDPDSLRPENFFAQMWNYQHMAAYGSLEWSLRAPEVPGHDPIEVSSVHSLSEDGRRFFVEMPGLIPAMQMQLYGRLQSAAGEEFRLDLYPTLIALRDDFTEFPGYTATGDKETDLTLRVKWPIPFTPKVPQQNKGRGINVTSVAGLVYEQTQLRVKAGEDLSINVVNRDSIPHNWVLGDIGTLEKIGEASNRMMANPDADKLHYVPDMKEVLHYTPMLERNERYTLHIKAPETPGTYPYLCTFPGHWLIMKGEMIVE